MNTFFFHCPSWSSGEGDRAMSVLWVQAKKFEEQSVPLLCYGSKQKIQSGEKNWVYEVLCVFLC